MIRVVRLGSPRLRGEGVRIGTVRRPPRGVRRSDIAKRNFYDVWLPELSPSAALVKVAQLAGTPAAWARFKRRYRSEMSQPAPSRLLDLLAAMSQDTNFAVGCYCVDEDHCHRSVLRELLAERGADVEVRGEAKLTTRAIPKQQRPRRRRTR